MARMSIDDKFLRDPRVAVLGKSCGWSVRETRGCLLDVWAVCYDQVTPLLSKAMIDIAAGLDGFADRMLEAELATLDRSGKLRIEGATKRIEYLDHKRTAGQQGGRKSAESRDKEVKQTSSTTAPGAQARGNPILTVTATASVPDEVPDRESGPRARSISPASTPEQNAITAPIAQESVARMGADSVSGPSAGWRKLASDVWAIGAARYRELLAEGVDPAASPEAWNGLARPIVSERTRDMREAGLTVEQALKRFQGAVDTAAATARKKRTLQWFLPTKFLQRDSFDRDADATPAQVTASIPTVVEPDNGLRIVGPQRAPGDDEPRFSAAEIAATDFTRRLTPVEKQRRLAALVAGSKAP